MARRPIDASHSSRGWFLRAKLERSAAMRSGSGALPDPSASLAEPAIGAGDVPSRNGLRKIYKSEFDEDFERFVLRIGYPNFPKRTSGKTATMLGFDTAEQTYVWSVPSIIRDPRLPYHGEFATDDE